MIFYLSKLLNTQQYINTAGTNVTVFTINQTYGSPYINSGYSIYQSQYHSWANEYGQLHNEEGPAKIYKDGKVEFWLNGEQIKVDNQEQFQKYLKYKELW